MMRSNLTIYPIHRRRFVAKSRRRSEAESFARIMGKLNAASEVLARARRRR